MQLSEKEFKVRLVAEEGNLKALLPSGSSDDVIANNEGEGEGEGGGGERAGEVAKQAAVVKYLKVSFKIFTEYHLQKFVST